MTVQFRQTLLFQPSATQCVEARVPLQRPGANFHFSTEPDVHGGHSPLIFRKREWYGCMESLSFAKKPSSPQIRTCSPFSVPRSAASGSLSPFAVHGWLYPNGFCHERNPPWNALATEEDSYLGC